MHLGRLVFGVASLLLGIACLVLHDQLISSWQLPGDSAFLVVTSAALIAGGAAIQLPRTARIGAAILGSVYLIFSLTFVPGIFAQPTLYASWGNVFYQLPPVSGAIVAYYVTSPASSYAKIACRAAVIILGLSYGSFAIEQIEFLARTASLVPKWVPPSGTFWTIATTIAFGLAAIAMVSGYKSLLASRLSALMLALFGITIWIPLLIADPKTHSNWSEGLETFAIAGAAWIVAERLDRKSLSLDSRLGGER
jgi:hypothetical protein